VRKFRPENRSSKKTLICNAYSKTSEWPEQKNVVHLLYKITIFRVSVMVYFSTLINQVYAAKHI